MSGHSKWSSIKHKKAATDAKRGQLFTKLAREVSLAAREGGGDPEMNARLRLAIQRARDANMPKDNIERAIQRGAGGGDGEALIEITYEGYGPGGTAVLVEAVTDNRNRTVAEVRNAFTRGGGNMADAGAVAWQFEMRGVIVVDVRTHDVDEVQLTAIEAGALDVSADDDIVEVITEREQLEAIREALTDADIEVTGAELAQFPSNVIELDESKAIQALRLLERLDELDDVARVFSNADFPEEALEAVAAS
ncbi:MAG TPA: YebC/PmpR family DNA-binding transcriptional regulator [Dehalococcoidia bacterium]|nr:YebC/PmpR family DNA-binding transcriptional regulator [Dehalococcoidia bacterium]